MKSRLKAQLISESFQGKEPSEVVKHDPELRELESLSALLGTVSKAEPMPGPEAQTRMKERVMECHLQVAEGEKKRERDPARRVSILDTRRLSYATLAAAAVIAAILVVSSLLFTAPGKVGVPPTMGLAEGEAWVLATGKVEVRPPGGEWSEREAPWLLTQGSSVRTPADTRAELAFGGDSYARIDAGSEVGILAVGEEGISLQMRQGEGYFRAQKGTPLRVFGGGLEVETLGTVFDLDLGGDGPELLALEDDVNVGVFQGEMEAVLLEEGKMLGLPELLGEDGLTGQVRDISPERLQGEWLLWNRDQDETRGLAVGILVGVEPQVAQAPGITPLGPAPPPGEEEDQQEEDGQPGISLQGTLQNGGITLSWELRDGTAQEFTILRAIGREPAYPQDELARVAGNIREFLDRGVMDGMSYTYRVAFEHQGEMVLSNAVNVNTPQVKPTMTLSGRAIDGGGGMPVIELAWHVEGPLQPDYYALVRAEMNQPPVFPPVGSMLSIQFNPSGPDYKYIDRELYMGYTYNYRVFAIKGGQIILDSNTVSIYVDTTVILKTPR